MYPYRSGECTRFGKSSTGNQRYRCRECKRTHSKSYTYRACKDGTNISIRDHIREGCDIRSISRLLKISCTTVLKRITDIAKAVTRPVIAFGKEYELDEVCTYLKKKTNLRWIVYALRKDNRKVVTFSVGCRTNKTLKLVTDTLVLSAATRVYTDKLPQYGVASCLAMTHELWKINIENLPTGVYVVKVTDSEGVKTVSKFVKE